MTHEGGSWTPQDILWELGASLIDATTDTASVVMEAVIERVGRVLEASAVGVWTISPRTMVGSEVHVWAATADSELGSGVNVSPDPAVRDAVMAGGGMATVPLPWILGAEMCEARGWTDGVALVAIINQSPDETRVLVVAAAEDRWDEVHHELIQGVVLIVRQFNRRLEAEDHLRQRRRLDELTVALAARLQTVGPEDLDDAVQEALVEVREATRAESIVLVDVIDDNTVRIPHMVAEQDLPPEWRTVPVPDISAVPGAEGLTIREFIAEPRVIDVADLVDALMGPEMSAAFGLRTPPRNVALLPASIVDGDALIGVTRLGVEEWTDQEFDALSTLASVIAQTRGRVEAQNTSNELLTAQRVLSATGRAFLQASAETVDDATHDAIARIGTTLGADLAVIARIDDEDVTITQTWEETPDSFAVRPGHVVSRTDFPMIEELLVAETDVSIREISEDVAAALQANSGGRWTTAVAPIRGVGLTPKALAFVWTTSEVRDRDAAADVVNAAADLVAQLLVRMRAEADLRTRIDIDAVLSELADRFLGSSLDSAEEVTEAAFERFGTALDLRGIALRRMGPDEAVVEASWAPRGRVRPQVGHTIALERPVSPEALDEFRRRDERIAELAELHWGPEAEVTVAPVVVGGSVDATLLAASTRTLSDLEIEAVRNLAVMLGQFRARLNEERQGRERLAAQRLLGACAADLAEATPDDYLDVLRRVYSKVGAYCDLAGIFEWRVDERWSRYSLSAWWTADRVSNWEVPETIEWGRSANLDGARTTGRSRVDVEDVPFDEGPSRAAIPRGDATSVDRIIVAVRTDATPISDSTVELLESVCQMVHEVDVRIGAQRYAQAAFEGAPIGVVLRDELLNLITCNQAFVDFVGAESVDELIGTAPQFVYDDTYEAVGWSEEVNGQLTSEAAFRGPGGARVWGQMRASVIQGYGGDHFWLIHIEDVTERRRAEQLLRFQASHDELTGLANRRRLLDEIHRLKDGAGSVAVLLLDLDRFKNINDSLGHDRGDELLVVIADRLRLAVRPGDLVARLGGDEFAIVLPGPVAVSEAEYVAERLMRLIGEPVLLGRQKLSPTASIGIAVADATTAVDDLIRRADTAMYRAKSEGRARAESFDEELRDAVHVRMATEAGLRDALRSNDLLVYYQPEVSLVDGRVLGAEALIRWNHPERGILPAGAFIEIAEETGLVVEMGELVLAEACAEAVRWAGDDGPMIRVNLAAAQLQREDTVSLVRSVLAETELAPSRLCLEITESAVMHDVHRSEEILHRLKNLGVHLAVDDFGTGFSSLAYLKRFPVDALKIDRAFVNDLAVDNEDVAFVRSIVSLADALGLDVVAEGVETAEQAALLLELGCTRAQGFYYAEPAPAAALRTRLGLTL